MSQNAEVVELPQDELTALETAAVVEEGDPEKVSICGMSAKALLAVTLIVTLASGITAGISVATTAGFVTAGGSPNPTSSPTSAPSKFPTASPTNYPTTFPTKAPIVGPTRKPTYRPTSFPTTGPTLSPTFNPTLAPTISPSTSPTRFPSQSPTNSPTSSPTISPTLNPTLSPSTSPTMAPTLRPTLNPTTFAIGCRCVPKICVPTAGGSAGNQVYYPADGSMRYDGHNWCFVESSCQTTQLGNQHTCDGVKFANIDGHRPSWSNDPRPVFGIPNSDSINRVFCRCITRTCTPTKGPNRHRSTTYRGDGSMVQDGHGWCFVEGNCATTQLGNEYTCNGAKFAFSDGHRYSWSRDNYPVYGLFQRPFG